MPRLRWRHWLRALHRDVGNFAIGLTLVYACSGLAVNHIADWDANFASVEATHQLALPVPQQDEALAQRVISELKLNQPLRESYRLSDDELELVFDQGSFRVHSRTGLVRESGQRPRFFLRTANWLHLNRGKRAWTIVADAYAIALLWLAFSGLLMVPGRRGVLGRGGAVAALGALIPILYVALSGGP